MLLPTKRNSLYCAIWKACQKIPRGKVASYSYLAHLISKPKAARLVARAMAMNPYAPKVPCHRIIRKDGSLAGYSAPGGLQRKKELLVKEGVGFDLRGRVLKKFILSALFFNLAFNAAGAAWAQNSDTPNLHATMEKMAELERFFWSLKKKFKTQLSPKDHAQYHDLMKENLLLWKRLFEGLLNQAPSQEKLNNWNSYVSQSLKEIESLEISLEARDGRTFWLHFDRLLNIKQKAHREFRPGLSRFLRKLFKRKEKP